MNRYLFLFFCLTIRSVDAQVNDIYPDTYINFFSNYSIYNPSYFSHARNMELYTNYKSRLAPFNSVATLSLTGALYFKDGKDRNHQLIRAHLYNEREGSYIQQPRAWVDYAYRVYLSKEISWAMGLSLGVNQFNVTAPSSTANGNSTAPDVSIGSIIKYKTFLLGASMKQLLNAKIQPLGATLRYKSFLMIQSSYQYVFANRSDLQFHLLSSIYSLDNIHYTLGAIYTFHESISFGMLYKHLYGISGIIQYTVSAPRFDVLFSMAYQTPIQSSAQNVVPAMQLDFGLIK